MGLNIMITILISSYFVLLFLLSKSESLKNTLIEIIIRHFADYSVISGLFNHQFSNSMSNARLMLHVNL